MADQFYKSRWFLLSSGALFLIIVGLALAPFLISLDRFRPEIVAMIENETGRKIEIGSLRLSLLPTTHVEIAEFRVKNSEGFPEGNTLEVGKIDIGATIGSLLRRQLQVTSVNVSGVRLNLLEDSRGKTNYEALAQTAAAPLPQEGSGGEPLVTLKSIDAASARDVEVSFGGYDQSTKKASPFLSLSGLEADVKDIDLSFPDWLRKVALNANLKGAVLRSASLSKPLKLDDGVFAVKDGAGHGTIKLSLDTMRAEGEAKIPNIESPVIEFKLSAPEIDLQRLGALATTSKEAIATAQASSLSAARLLAQGEVEIQKLKLPPYSAERVKSTIKIYPGRIEADPFRFGFYGGSGDGSGRWNRAEAGSPLRASFNIRDADMLRLGAAYRPNATKRIAGTLEAHGRLDTLLDREAVAALRGQGSFSVRDGALQGVSIQGTLASLAKLFQVSVPSGDTRFSYFGADFEIRGQRIYSKAITLNAEQLSANGSGSAGFDGTLDYEGIGELTGQGQQSESQSGSSSPLKSIDRAFGGVVEKTLQTIGLMRVPFSVKGTAEDPKFALSGVPQPLGRGQKGQSQSPDKAKKKGLLDIFKR